MGKTLKDAPYVVQQFKRGKKKAPKNWREQYVWQYAFGRHRGIPNDQYADYRERCAELDELPDAHIGDRSLGEFANERTREYRHRTNQVIKDWDFEGMDNLDKPVRDARWDFY